MTLSEVILDAAALRHNFETLRRWYGGTPLFPVVKANAYGHGSDLICLELERAFDEKALPSFCVARYSEAMRIRAAGVKRRILVLSHFSATEWLAEPLADIDVVIADAKRDLGELAKLPEGIRASIGVHVKFDTGMGRLGAIVRGEAEEAASALEHFAALKGAGLRARGILSHLARSEEAPELLSSAQVERFEALLKALRAGWREARHGEFPQWIHLANSSGIERGIGRGLCNAARPGLHLWGVSGGGQELARLEAEGKLSQLRPVLSVEGPVRQLKIVRAGEGVGYGHRYVAPSERLVGLVSLGYADGVFRQLSRRADEPWRLGFVVEGARMPVAGTVSMDLTALDLSDHPKASEWKAALRAGRVPELRAEWIGPRQRVEEHGDVFETISYEILCALTSRLPRRWKTE